MRASALAKPADTLRTSAASFAGAILYGWCNRRVLESVDNQLYHTAQQAGQTAGVGASDKRPHV